MQIDTPLMFKEKNASMKYTVVGSVQFICSVLFPQQDSQIKVMSIWTYTKSEY